MRNKLSLFIKNLPEIIAGAALSIALIFTAVNAFSRYILEFTYVGKDEIVAICFAYTVFFGAVAVYKRNMHYGLDFLVRRFPPKAKKYVDIVTTIITLTVIGCLTYLGMVLTANTGWKIMTATRISYFYLDAGMLISFFLMTVYSGIELVKRIRGLRDAPCDTSEKKQQS